MRTEKSRLQRSLLNLRELMQRMRHLPILEQVENLNRVLRSNFSYDGIVGIIELYKEPIPHATICGSRVRVAVPTNR